MLMGSIITARLLGGEEFGVMGTVQSTVALLAGLAGLGVALGASKQIAQAWGAEPAQCGGIAALVLTVCISSGSAAMFAMMIGSRTVAALTGIDSMQPHMLRAAPLLLMGVVAGGQLGILQGLQQFRIASIWTLLRNVSTVIGMTVGARLNGLDGTIQGLVIAEVVSVVGGQVLVSSSMRTLGVHLKWAGCWQYWGSLWRFGVPSLLSTLAVLPALWAGRTLLLRQSDGLTQAGIFDVANRWSQLASFVPAALAPLQLPILAHLRARADHQQFRDYKRLWLGVGAGAATVIAVGLSVIAVPLMRTHGPEFEAGWPVLILLGATAIPSAVNGTLGASLVARDRVWLRSGVDLVIAGVLFISAMLLVPAHAALGLATAHLIGYLTGGLLLIALQRQQSERGPTVVINTEKRHG